MLNEHNFEPAQSNTEVQIKKTYFLQIRSNVILTYPLAAWVITV